MKTEFPYCVWEKIEEIKNEEQQSKMFIIFVGLLSCCYCQPSNDGKLTETILQKSVAPSSVSDKSLIAHSQVECLLNQLLDDCQCWLLEFKQISPGKFNCSFFVNKNELVLVDNDNSTILVQHGSVCKQNKKPGQPCYVPSDCQEYKTLGAYTNGVYKIKIKNTEVIKSVYCDMTTFNGSWTTIQKRTSAEVNFTRGWSDYKNGFGNPSSNYWLGLDAMHHMTKNIDQMLIKIEAESFNGNHAYVIFRGFKVASESEKYRLTTGECIEKTSVYFNGDTGYTYCNSWSRMNQCYFSTPEIDNDNSNGKHCAKTRKSGGWFKQCTLLNFNGIYSTDGTDSGDYYLHWVPLDNHEALKTLSMAIKHG
ncbi:fibrinogen-like protein 1 [Clytia hemisphaerica]|uniref:fibrinogen-like protein 1 n=1 Tax=Clytia hemisphaerica TaxID=252671 RepID=UPI0034D5FF0C